MGTPTAELRKRFAKLGEMDVAVGWFPEDVYPESGVSMAYIAAINEFGHTRTLKNGNQHIIPARPFMRQTMSDKGATISKNYATTVNRFMADGDKAHLGIFGRDTVAKFKDTIQNGKWQRNAESTINGMILKYDKNGNPVRAGWRASKDGRKFGQGKGKDTPLIDTAQMMNRMTYKVGD